MLDEDRHIIESVMHDIGLTGAQIALAFEDTPEGRKYMSKLCKTYVLDAYSIQCERVRSQLKTFRDYENEMAIAKTEGMLETLAGLVKDGILTVVDAAKRANMTVTDFESKTGLKA